MRTRERFTDKAISQRIFCSPVSNPLVLPKRPPNPNPPPHTPSLLPGRRPQIALPSRSLSHAIAHRHLRQPGHHSHHHRPPDHPHLSLIRSGQKLSGWRAGSACYCDVYCDFVGVHAVVFGGVECVYKGKAARGVGGGCCVLRCVGGVYGEYARLGLRLGGNDGCVLLVTH